MSGANPKLRRRARVSAMQALYQMEVTELTGKAVIAEFMDHRFGYDDEPGMIHVDEAYFEDVVKGVVAFQKDIDPEIESRLPEKWPLRRLDATLRALLRTASYELMRRPDVPALVVINEYLSIASEFFSGKEPGLVNAVLDKLAKSVRSAEFGLTAAHIAPVLDAGASVLGTPSEVASNEDE